MAVSQKTKNRITMCSSNSIPGYLSEENNKLSISTMNDHIYSRKFDTKLGTIICENHGEFGGVIYKNTNE